MRRAAAGVPAALALAAAAQAQRVTFDQVAPTFAARCKLCRAGVAAPLGLRLDS